MNIINLRYFVTTVEEMNFSRAAKKLFITQQSLSKHIANIEEECGMELFQRSRGKEVIITEAGRSFYQNAKDILNIYDKSQKQLKDLKNFQENELIIAVPRVRDYYVLPAILEEYCASYPDVHIKILSGSSTNVAEAIRNGEADVGIGIDIQDTTVDCIELTREKQYVVLHETLFQKYFSKEQREELLSRKTVPLSVFSDCPFILCDTDIWSGAYFEKLREADPFDAKILIKSNDYMVAFRMCKIGLGASIISGSLLQYLQDDSRRRKDLVYFAVDDRDFHDQSHMYLVTKKNEYLSSACKAFIKIVKKKYNRK